MTLPSEHHLTVTQSTLPATFACDDEACKQRPKSLDEAISHAATSGCVVAMSETKRTRIEAAPTPKASR